MYLRFRKEDTQFHVHDAFSLVSFPSRQKIDVNSTALGSNVFNIALEKSDQKTLLSNNYFGNLECLQKCISCDCHF